MYNELTPVIPKDQKLLSASVLHTSSSLDRCWALEAVTIMLEVTWKPDITEYIYYGGSANIALEKTFKSDRSTLSSSCDSCVIFLANILQELAKERPSTLAII